MAKYKVGDKVKVREDLKVGNKYFMEVDQYSVYYTEYMSKFSGKILTISKIDTYEHCYWVEENYHTWTDEMFIGLANQESEADSDSDSTTSTTETNIFTKADLKTGMIITTRNGEEHVVFLNCSDDEYKKDILILKTNGWESLSCYKDNLLYNTEGMENIKGIEGFDIMKVELPSLIRSMSIFDEQRTLVWQRTQEISMEEALEKLEEVYGCKVKITES